MRIFSRILQESTIKKVFIIFLLCILLTVFSSKSKNVSVDILKGPPVGAKLNQTQIKSLKLEECDTLIILLLRDQFRRGIRGFCKFNEKSRYVMYQITLSPDDIVFNKATVILSRVEQNFYILKDILEKKYGPPIDFYSDPFGGSLLWLPKDGDECYVLTIFNTFEENTPEGKILLMQLFYLPEIPFKGEET